MSIAKTHQRRYTKTLAFLKKHLPQGSQLLDLGTENPFTPFLKEAGYSVQNTKGENLDDDFKAVAKTACDCVTAFEIFEHLIGSVQCIERVESR